MLLVILSEKFEGDNRSLQTAVLLTVKETRMAMQQASAVTCRKPREPAIATPSISLPMR